MKLLHVDIPMPKRLDSRFELFVFGDTHIGKRNCAEHAILKQVKEIQARAQRPDRVVRVVYGGDIPNLINHRDVRRFDFRDLADWLVKGDPEDIAERLSRMPAEEIRRALSFFKPLAPLSLGAVEGNHEFDLLKHYGYDAQQEFCDGLGIPDLTDQALLRLRFTHRTSTGAAISTTAFVYLRHGYGGGRTAGAEPIKLAALASEWSCADVCLTGHTHTTHTLPPIPVLYVPERGALPCELLQRYRFAANWGCWLYSHKTGKGSYESRKCYPARPMMTVKVVIWPFFRVYMGNKDYMVPKIELREYPIL